MQSVLLSDLYSNSDTHDCCQFRQCVITSLPESLKVLFQIFPISKAIISLTAHSFNALLTEPLGDLQSNAGGTETQQVHKKTHLSWTADTS